MSTQTRTETATNPPLKKLVGQKANSPLKTYKQLSLFTMLHEKEHSSKLNQSQEPGAPGEPEKEPEKKEQHP